MLTTIDSLPEGLLDLAATDLHRVLRGPTLVHLDGTRPEPLFLSVLLHGNETTGWEAVRTVLGRYRDRPLPRALSLLVGNVAAANAGLRCLPGQPDYNRVWRGEGTPEHGMARAVLEQMRDRAPFAAIDVHNTSGRNPEYACITVTEPATLHLAHLFGPIVVFFTRPDTTLTAAFADVCPSLTVECGLPGDARGVAHVAAYLERCLRLEAIPAAPPAEVDALDVFHSVAVVKIPEDVQFGFGVEGVDLRLDAELDRRNFREVPAGTAFGTVREGSEARLVAFDESGADVADLYFRRDADRLVNTVPVYPAMLTLDERIIRQDCLCYLMERRAGVHDVP